MKKNFGIYLEKLPPVPHGTNIAGWQDVEIRECGEKLVDLRDYGVFEVYPQYFFRNIPGSINTCLVRQGIVNRLIKAHRLLPSKYQFIIWDGYRPLQVQKWLYCDYKNKLKNQYPSWNNSLLNKQTQKFVSLPSTDYQRPSPHNTGGAFDITLAKDGLELNLGTDFDYFGSKAIPEFFESKTPFTNDDNEIIQNRRILYWSLKLAGFSNYPFEWWHWSYGDQMSQAGTHNYAIYGGVN